jgi:hypothetical protein
MRWRVACHCLLSGVSAMSVLRFFLGGRDLEMVEIRRLLDRHAPDRFEDLGLSWGARASAYLPGIEAALARGETPVLVELIDDLPATMDRARLRVVDHHGNAAWRPTAIEQVFALLGLPSENWTRHMMLVAVNDRAHVDGLIAIGASAEEVAAIRAADRAVQGVTAADEAEAARAIATRQVVGRLTEIRTTSNTSSAIADGMLPVVGGPGHDALLVVMPGKLSAFADGAAIQRLSHAVPGGYWGGDLPRRGYWGITLSAQDAERVTEAVRALLRCD